MIIIKPIRVGNFWNENYIKYETNSDRSKSVKEYLNKIKPYLRDITINLQKSGTWKVHLTTFIFSVFLYFF